MPKVFISILFLTALLFCKISVAQDSASKKNPTVSKPDTTKKIIKPRVAIIRSAVIPGWGQFTNKKYWKIPIVYAALGITTTIFFRNAKQYREARDAYVNATDGDPTNDSEIPQPYYTVKDQPERIRSFRNSVRQNVDYTVLFFIAFWGLNVVDAAVDAHLKSFDVSDDLSIQIKAGYSPMANTNGVSLVFNLGRNHSK
jgi:uncharacterized protein DUF5683